MGGGIPLQARAQIIGIDDWPNICADTGEPQYLSSIQRSYTETDVADMSIRRKILISEHNVHLVSNSCAQPPTQPSAGPLPACPCGSQQGK